MCIRDRIDVLEHEIDVVLTKAWTVEIIGEQVRGLAQSANLTSRLKAEKFVAVVRARMKTDPLTFTSFLTILRSSPSLGHLAVCLEEKICETYREPSPVAETVQSGPQSMLTSTPRSTPSKCPVSHESLPTLSQSAGTRWRHKPSKRPRARGSTGRTIPSGQAMPKLETRDETDEESGFLDEDSTTVERVDNVSDVLDDNENECEAMGSSNHHFGDSSTFPAPTEVANSGSDFKPFSEDTTGELETGTHAQEKSAEELEEESHNGEHGIQELHHNAVSQQQVVGGIQTTAEGWAEKAHFYIDQGAANEMYMVNKIEDLKENIAALQLLLDQRVETNAQKRHKMEEQIHIQEVDLENYQQMLGEKQRELDSLRAQRNEEVQAAEEKLQKEREEHKIEIEKVEEEVKSLQQQLGEKSTETKQLRLDYNELKRTTDEKIEELEQKLIAKTEEAAKLRDEYQQLEEKRRSEITQLESKYERKISELEELVQSQKEQARLKEENIKITLKNEYMEKEMQRLKDETELKLQIKDLKMELEQMHREEKARQHEQELKLRLEDQARQHKEDKAKLEQQIKIERTHSEIKIQEKQAQIDYKKELERLNSTSSTSSSEMSFSRSNTAGAEMDTITEEAAQLYIPHSDSEDSFYSCESELGSL